MAATTRTARAIRSKCSAPMRAVWPEDRPISVRLSCHDWTEGGNTPDDAAIFAAHVQGGRRRSDRLLVRARCRRRSSRSTAACSRRRSPIMIRNEGACRRPSRSARSRRPTTPIRSSPPAAPISAPSRARISPTPPGRCTRPRRSAPTSCPGRSNMPPRKAQYEANLARAARREARMTQRRRSPAATRSSPAPAAASARRSRAALARRGRARQPRRPPRASRWTRVAARACPTARRSSLDGFDVTDAEAIARGLATRARRVRPGRDPRQQRRRGAERAVREDRRRDVGACARRSISPASIKSRRPRWPTSRAIGAGGAHHQRRLDRGAHRLRLCLRLLRGQARRRRPDARARARTGAQPASPSTRSVPASPRRR